MRRILPIATNDEANDEALGHYRSPIFLWGPEISIFPYRVFWRVQQSRHREDGVPPGAQRAGKAGDEGGAHEGTEDPTGVVPETRRLVETAAARVASVERGSWGGPRDHDDERVAARSR